MYILKDILAKDRSEWTEGELKFVKSQLSEEQLKQFGVSKDGEDDDKKDDETETEEQTDVEVDDEVASKIADAVAEKMLANSIEKDAPVKKAPAQVEVKETLEEDGKEVRFVKGLAALVKGDTIQLAKINKINGKMRTKAGYQNETTPADGGYLLPDADFERDVARLEEQYGAARQGGITVRRTAGNTLKVNKKGSGVTMYELNEAAAKTGTKMTFSQVEVTLRKFAAIAIVTDELEEDAAIDVYNELTRDFAREKARVEDTLVFTDATSGITEQSGVIVTSVGTNWSDLDGDDLLNAINSVPTEVGANGSFFMHRNAFNQVRKMKVNAESNHYLVQPDPNGRPSIFGRPVILTEVLNSNVAATNQTFAIYTDLGLVSRLVEKRGLVLDIGREGTVHDSAGNAFNLFEQDAKALRAVSRMNHKLVWPQGVALIGTGTVS